MRTAAGLHVWLGGGWMATLNALLLLLYCLPTWWTRMTIYRFTPPLNYSVESSKYITPSIYETPPTASMLVLQDESTSQDCPALANEMTDWLLLLLLLCCLVCSWRKVRLILGRLWVGRGKGRNTFVHVSIIIVFRTIRELWESSKLPRQAFCFDFGSGGTHAAAITPTCFTHTTFVGRYYSTFQGQQRRLWAERQARMHDGEGCQATKHTSESIYLL